MIELAGEKCIEDACLIGLARSLESPRDAWDHVHLYDALQAPMRARVTSSDGSTPWPRGRAHDGCER
jgi:hypothetical protein